MLQVNDIFKSIDGEICGTNGIVGMQGGWTVFIRLQGCNLNPFCSWCDTKQGQLPDSSKEMTIDQILERIWKVSEKRKIKKVTITGGEPLLQESSLIFLLHRLWEKKFYISLETNGSFPISHEIRPFINSFIIDIKAPSSGNPTIDIQKKNFHCLGTDDFFKFVIANEKDFIWAIQKKKELKEITQAARFAMSALFNNQNEMIINPIELMEKYNEYDFIFNLQIHKIVRAK